MKSRILKKTIRRFVLKTGLDREFFEAELPSFRKRRTLVRHMRRVLQDEMDYHMDRYYGVGYLGTSGEAGVWP
jgi:hypothetical protein